MPKKNTNNKIHAYRTKQGAVRVIIWLTAILICMLITLFVLLTPF